MSVPDFQTIMRPLLALHSDGQEHEIAATREAVADHFDLSPADRQERIPSGSVSTYIQAKSWGKSVGRPEIQAFAGALQGRQATKGIFITTSDFTTGATDYVKSIPSRVILVDGQRLAELMIEHGVGVSVRDTYELKEVDLSYFSTEGEPAAP